MNVLSFVRVLLICSMQAAMAAPQPAPRPAENQPLAASMRATFDMTKNPRPYIVFMILDQEGNRHPSFWCGRNLEGQLRFDGKVDMLDGTFSLGQAGSLAVQLTHAPRKLGMNATVPGGEWIDGLRERSLKIVFKKFADPSFPDGKKGAAAEGTTIAATCEGTVSVGDRTAPFAGTATLTFSDAKATYALRAHFPLPAAKLGLEGPRGEGITATLYTASAPGAARMSMKGESDSGPPGDSIEIDTESAPRRRR